MDIPTKRYAKMAVPMFTLYWHFHIYLLSEQIINPALVGFGDHVSEFLARAPSLLNSLPSIYYLAVSVLQLNKLVVWCSTSLSVVHPLSATGTAQTSPVNGMGRKEKLKNSSIALLEYWCKQIKICFWLAWTVLKMRDKNT